MMKRCKDCKHWDKNSSGVHYLLKRICYRLDGDIWEKDTMACAITDGGDYGIITAPNFGCVLFEPK